jgi:hypothetical protein
MAGNQRHHAQFSSDRSLWVDFFAQISLDDFPESCVAARTKALASQHEAFLHLRRSSESWNPSD